MIKANCTINLHQRVLSHIVKISLKGPIDRHKEKPVSKELRRESPKSHSLVQV